MDGSGSSLSQRIALFAYQADLGQTDFGDYRCDIRMRIFGYNLESKIVKDYESHY